jgi:hypothetical protein
LHFTVEKIERPLEIKHDGFKTSRRVHLQKVTKRTFGDNSRHRSMKNEELVPTRPRDPAKAIYRMAVAR